MHFTVLYSTVHVQSVFIAYLWCLYCYATAESHFSTDFILYCYIVDDDDVDDDSDDNWTS